MFHRPHQPGYSYGKSEVQNITTNRADDSFNRISNIDPFDHPRDMERHISVIEKKEKIRNNKGGFFLFS
jgi:hypothetical protein